MPKKLSKMTKKELVQEISDRLKKRIKNNQITSFSALEKNIDKAMEKKNKEALEGLKTFNESFKKNFKK